MSEQEFSDETEQVLIKLHTDLTDFYTRHNHPEKCTEDVLTILMQFFIDAGEEKLNEKLRKKYNEDLTNFRLNKKRPQRAAARPARNTINRLSRMSLSKEYNMELAPDPKVETSYETTVSSPTKGKTKAGGKGRKPKRTKGAKSKLRNLGLNVLDYAPIRQISNRQRLEGFYTIHDPQKIKIDAVMNKFLQYIEENGVSVFSKKLEAKYGEGLDAKSVKEMINRRVNLEDKLVQFYEQNDRDKLRARWAIVEIISWTMTNGIENLNKKFELRYGKRVV
eukprot:snap_masked-scaffold_5-processed-gene-15.25-mRNA-1 protein AED:1.00 eAED:1.00 QI:0/-1/0/0/-1/1/1/0/277